MLKLPGYTIEQELGHGGMAVVYLGQQQSLKRPVAIKVLNADMESDPFVQLQFQQESLMVAKLNHPNIIQVIDQGVAANGGPYFVMQYVKSIPLTAIINRNDVNLTRKLDIAIQICRALSYAHRNGVVHRDIKPANILVDYDGHVRVVDFGIAGYFKKAGTKGSKETQSVIMGTPNYMAPEQLDPKAEITYLSDIYALGVLMHELFSGCLPAELEIKPEDIPRALWDLVQQCLSRNTSERPQSADELTSKLLELLHGRHLNTPRWEQEKKSDVLPGNYELIDILKENSYGSTYLVSEPKSRQWLVVKKQAVEYEGTAYSSSQALAGVEHDNIVSILGTAKNDRVFITVMEYVKGGSLQDRLTQAFSLPRWVMLAQQMCAGLHQIHQLGLIHGNLRPSNVLVMNPGHVKLSDIGYLEHNAVADDDWYQPNDEEKSIASDVFSTGAVLFHLLTGVAIEQVQGAVRNLDKLDSLSPPLVAILKKMLAANPQKRFGSSEEVRLALKSVFDTEKTVIVKPEVTEPTVTEKPQFSVLAKVALVLVALFFIAEGFWLFGGEGIGRLF